MSSDTENQGASPAYRLVHHYREKAALAIQEHNKATVNGYQNDAIKNQLATAALNLYNVLFEYRDENALDEPWSDRGIEWLEEAANETVPVEESLHRPNSATKTVNRPKLMAVDARRLVETIRELFDVANELGFSASVPERTGRTDMDDPVGKVRKWRQKQG